MKLASLYQVSSSTYRPETTSQGSDCLRVTRRLVRLAANVHWQAGVLES